MSAETQLRSTPEAPPEGLHYEDFSVGQRISVPRKQRPEKGGRAALDGVHTLLALASDGDVLPASLLGVLETRWRTVSTQQRDIPVEATFTVTACRRVPAGDAGSVRWHAQLHDGTGHPVQEGTIEVLLPARSGSGSGSDGPPGPAGQAFGSLGWGEALARRLAENEDFRSATATWDGAIGLQAGRDQVQLRVYRGRIIEVARRTPLGATFTLEGSEYVWTDLMTGPSNDFFRRAMSGDSFTVTGNAYEYLRLAKAVMALIDTARELAAGAGA